MMRSLSFLRFSFFDFISIITISIDIDFRLLIDIFLTYHFFDMCVLCVIFSLLPPFSMLPLRCRH
jgi:hypothetical protein